MVTMIPEKRKTRSQTAHKRNDVNSLEAANSTPTPPRKRRKTGVQKNGALNSMPKRDKQDQKNDGEIEPAPLHSGYATALQDDKRDVLPSYLSSPGTHADLAVPSPMDRSQQEIEPALSDSDNATALQHNTQTALASHLSSASVQADLAVPSTMDRSQQDIESASLHTDYTTALQNNTQDALAGYLSSPGAHADLVVPSTMDRSQQETHPSTQNSESAQTMPGATEMNLPFVVGTDPAGNPWVPDWKIPNHLERRRKFGIPKDDPILAAKPNPQAPHPDNVLSGIENVDRTHSKNASESDNMMAGKYNLDLELERAGPGLYNTPYEHWPYKNDFKYQVPSPGQASEQLRALPEQATRQELQTYHGFGVRGGAHDSPEVTKGQEERFRQDLMDVTNIEEIYVGDQNNQKLERTTDAPQINVTMETEAEDDEGTKTGSDFMSITTK